MTHATLGPMMYDPNVFTLNLEQLLSGKPLDAAIGVVQITLYSARGITGTKIGGGTPDPYVSLSISGRGELAKTQYKSNTYAFPVHKTYLICNLYALIDIIRHGTKQNTCLCTLCKTYLTFKFSIIMTIAKIR